MAIVQGARATSLAWTGSGVTSPLSDIQDYSFSHSKQLAEFFLGTARVSTLYAGRETASITVTSGDLLKMSGFAVGQKYTNAILTLEAASDSAGTLNGGTTTITLSQVVVTAVGDITMGNEDSRPVTRSVTMTLSRHVGSADPTAVIAAGA